MFVTSVFPCQLNKKKNTHTHINSGLLGTLKEFRNRFTNPVTAGLTSDASSSEVRLGKQRMAVLHSKVQGFVHRRSAATLVRRS
jgi:hypothetical protein